MLLGGSLLNGVSPAGGGTNNAPTFTSFPNADDVFINAAPGGAYTITHAQLLAASNFSDADGDVAIFVATGAALDGTLTKSAVAVAAGTEVAPGDSLVWTPVSTGDTHCCAFTAKDRHGGATSTPVTLTISTNTDPFFQYDWLVASDADLPGNYELENGSLEQDTDGQPIRRIKNYSTFVGKAADLTLGDFDAGPKLGSEQGHKHWDMRSPSGTPPLLGTDNTQAADECSCTFIARFDWVNASLNRTMKLTPFGINLETTSAGGGTWFPGFLDRTYELQGGPYGNFLGQDASQRMLIPDRVKYHIITWTRQNDGVRQNYHRIYVDGVLATEGKAYSDTDTLTGERFTLGGSYAGDSDCAMRINKMMFINECQDEETVLAIQNYYLSHCSLLNDAPENVLVHMGDSLSRLQNCSTSTDAFGGDYEPEDSYVVNYIEDLLANHGLDYGYVNAISGYSIQSWETEAALARAAAYLNKATVNPVCLCYLGSNNISGTGRNEAAALAYANLVDFMQLLQARVTLPIKWILTTLGGANPSTAAVYVSRMPDFNDAIRDNLTDGPHTVCDLAATPIGDPNAWSDLPACFLTDGGHQNGLGQLMMPDVFSDAVAEIIDP